MNSDKILNPLSSLKRVHVIGVGGTLMGAFAAYLKRQGVQVTGSDQNLYPPMSDVLAQAGVELFSSYEQKNLDRNGIRPDLVVIGNVIRADNPEARAAIDRGYDYTSLPAAMEKYLLQKTRNIVISGTHGKTTTSSLMAHVLRTCNADPNYFIGGVSEDLPYSFHVSSIEENRAFVLEGDEYDTAFWDKVPKFFHYLPDDVILTSIEYDHADIYPNMEAIIQAFDHLVSRIRKGGRLVACYDYPWVREAARKSRSRVISYGSSFSSGARYIPGELRINSEGLTCFDVLDKEKAVDEIEMQISGSYNALNALAVWVESREIGLNSDLVKEAFRSFRGVKRRQEIKADIHGILIIDDFAHHPTAVRETLRGIQMRFPGRRIVAVFEPRSATSRRKVFQAEYASAFNSANLIFISAPYDQSRIAAEDCFSSEALVQDLKNSNQMARLISTVDEGVNLVTESLRSGDVVVVLSNGGFGGMVTKLVDRVKLKSNFLS